MINNQIPMNKQSQNNNTTNPKQYDLEERTFKYSKTCRDFVKKLPKNITNNEYAKQLTRSSGSVSANYIEANESISKKDFYHRIKISRKEAKESRLWARLCEINDNLSLKDVQSWIIDESMQLIKIFTSIISKSKI